MVVIALLAVAGMRLYNLGVTRGLALAPQIANQLPQGAPIIPYMPYGPWGFRPFGWGFGFLGFFSPCCSSSASGASSAGSSYGAVGVAVGTGNSVGRCSKNGTAAPMAGALMRDRSSNHPPLRADASAKKGTRSKRRHSPLTRGSARRWGKLYLASGLSRSMVFASGDGAMDRTHV